MVIKVFIYLREGLLFSSILREVLLEGINCFQKFTVIIHHRLKRLNNGLDALKV